MNTGISDIKDKTLEAYQLDLVKEYPQVEKEASNTIASFSNLVNKLMKIKEISTADKKEQITKLANELNNTSVYFAKMIGDELGKLHNIINTEQLTDIKKVDTNTILST